MLFKSNMFPYLAIQFLKQTIRHDFTRIHTGYNKLFN